MEPTMQDNLGAAVGIHASSKQQVQWWASGSLVGARFSWVWVGNRFSGRWIENGEGLAT